MGRFTGVAPGTATLHAHRIGYAPVRLAAELSREGGLAAVLVAPPAPVVLCAILVEPSPAVVVRVRDVRTARAPAVPVTVVLRDGAFSDSATSVGGEEALNPDRAGVGPAREGRYTVHVRAPGFRPWTGRARAERRRGPCGAEFHPGSLDAWLVPR